MFNLDVKKELCELRNFSVDFWKKPGFVNYSKSEKYIIRYHLQDDSEFILDEKPLILFSPKYTRNLIHSLLRSVKMIAG